MFCLLSTIKLVWNKETGWTVRFNSKWVPFVISHYRLIEQNFITCHWLRYLQLFKHNLCKWIFIITEGIKMFLIFEVKGQIRFSVFQYFSSLLVGKFWWIFKVKKKVSPLDLLHEKWYGNEISSLPVVPGFRFILGVGKIFGILVSQLMHKTQKTKTKFNADLICEFKRWLLVGGFGWTDALDWDQSFTFRIVCLLNL